MRIRLLYLLTIFIFLYIPSEALSSNQPALPDDLFAMSGLSEEQQESLVKEWIHKSTDRIRWSHKARMDFAMSAYIHSQVLKNDALHVESILSLTELNFNDARFDVALSYIDTILEFAERTNNVQLSIRANNFKSSILRYNGNIFEALGISYNDFLKAGEINDQGLIALTANNLGVIYRNLGEKSSAVDFYNKALDAATQIGDTNQIIFSLTGLGNFYWFEKETDLAYEQYSKALALARKTNDMQHIASLLNNIGNYYRDLEKYEDALSWYKSAYELLDEVNVVGLKGMILRNTGITYLRKRDFDQALKYMHQSLAIAEEIQVQTFLRDNYSAISQIYRAKGDITRAYDYLLLHDQLNQKLHNVQLTNRVSYYSDKIYDAQRMEEMYKFRLERNFFILIIVLLILLFLSLFTFLTFKRFKDKRKHINHLKRALQDKVIIEKALRQSEENYQTLIKTLNEGLIVLDAENRIEFLNVKACTLLGVNGKDDLVGVSFEKFLLTPEDEKLFLEKVELQKMGISDHYEIKMKNLNGDVMWAHISAAPILDENLKTKGSVAMISDITEKKKSEQTFGELTANLNQKIKQLNCLYDITDISGAPGISFDEIIEKSLEIIPVGLKYSHDVGVQIVFDDKKYNSANFVDSQWSYSVPIKVQKKKLGYIKVAYVEEKPNINKDPFHFNEKILLKNISEKFGQIIESKNLEKVLRENQQKLQEVQRIAKIGNWEKDLTTEVCVFSDTFFDILNISPERRKFFEYSRLLEMIHPDDKEVFLSFERKMYKSEPDADVTANYRIITNEGAIKYIFSSGKIIFGDKGVAQSCVFTIQDITEQKYTQELQHHAELALKTSEAKQQVLANMSYEMRTPITGIMGMIDFLLNSGLNTHQLEYAKTIKDSGIGLLNTINNILDLQRMESGKFRLNNAVFGLSQLIDRVHSLFNALTRSKEIRLHIDVLPEVPEAIISDQIRLYQIISSLISIVTETAEKGNLTIRLNREAENGGRMKIVVSLIDDFSKIDIDEVNAIINPQWGEDELFIQKKNNINVSLAISKKLVDMLEGVIIVEKNELGGTNFFFSFYTTIANERMLADANGHSAEKIMNAIEGARILCVEDQKINQKVIGMMLSNASCTVTFAANGKEALDILKKSEFDLILLDMVMPVMDGLQTMKVMQEKFKIRPPIIALSANVLDEDKEKYFSAGVDDYISKPINVNELYQKIEKWTVLQKKLS